jgi:hypothetical protein
MGSASLTTSWVCLVDNGDILASFYQGKLSIEVAETRWKCCDSKIMIGGNRIADRSNEYPRMDEAVANSNEVI